MKKWTEITIIALLVISIALNIANLVTKQSGNNSSMNAEKNVESIKDVQNEEFSSTLWEDLKNNNYKNTTGQPLKATLREEDKKLIEERLGPGWDEKYNKPALTK